MNIDLKIGMIAPSGTGKTSLLAAMYNQVEQRLAEQTRADRIIVKPDDSTKLRIENAIVDFKTCVKHKLVWEPSEIKSTEGIESYKFLATTSNRRLDIQIEMRDYPGGMTGDNRFSGEMTPFINDCEVLIIPISTDYMMEWYRYRNPSDEESKSRSTAALTRLDVDNVINLINRWMDFLVKKKWKGLLIFVPVKCEKWFKDNFKQKKQGQFGLFTALLRFVKELFTKDYSQDVLDATKELFYENPKFKLDSGMAENIQVGIFCVDTYGIVELKSMKQGKNRELSPIFHSRFGMGKIIRTKNAANLFLSMLKFKIDIEQQKLNDLVNEAQDRLKEKDGEIKANETSSWWSTETSKVKQLIAEKKKLEQEINMNQTESQSLIGVVKLLSGLIQLSSKRTQFINMEED